MSESARRLGRLNWPMVGLLAFALAVGLWLARDFGISWDERRNADVGAAALRVFSGSTDYFSAPSLADHGPAYFMVFSGGSRLIAWLVPGWTEADGRHLINYLTFLAAVLAFYALSRRLVRAPYDWMMTAVFASQPLLFGYGFIGQKDTSFMAGFMATLAFGLAALDRAAASSAGLEDARTSGPDPWWASLRSDWSDLPRPRKILLVTAALAFAALVVDVFAVHAIQGVGERTIEAAYLGAAPGPLQTLFARIATDAYKTPLAAYLAKYRAISTTLGIVVVVLFGLGARLLLNRSFPSLRGPIGTRRLAGSSAWLVSGVLLGLTVSMRPIGAFAGLLVGFEALRVGRARVGFPLAVYWLVAALSTLATWPYLWPNPIGNMLRSLFLAADFSAHGTLFRGEWVTSGNLPWDYFPTQTALQLTETALALIVLGLVITIARLLRRRPQSPLMPILLLWVGVPLVVLIGFRASGYEFRHFLFMLPPLLIIGAVGLEALGSRVKRPWGRYLLFGVAVLPGLVGIARLHPYEYVYYNALAGGVSGAEGRFQLDRECLSYREAISFVNRAAPAGAIVAVPSKTVQVEPFARPDLVLRDLLEGFDRADFILACTMRDRNAFPTEGFSVVFEVRRGTAVLAEVWRWTGLQP